VSGAVFAAGGRLEIWTQNRHLRLEPRLDGTTAVLSCEPAHRPRGTRIAVWLDPAKVAPDQHVHAWLDPAILMFGGERFVGLSSPHWFDAPSFFEYLQAARGQTVRGAVATLARCSGGAAGALSQQWSGAATDLSPDEAAALLAHLQASVDPVAPKLLKAVGRRALYGLDAYALVETGFVPGMAGASRAKLPVLIEAWGGPSNREYARLCVNRSPSTARLDLRTFPEYDLARIVGCGIHDSEGEVGAWMQTKRRAPADLLINVTAPYLPRTSDGKAPDFAALSESIGQAVARVLDAVERISPSPKAPKPPKVAVITPPQAKGYKAAVLDILWSSIDDVSGDGARRYTKRQLFYPIRSALLNAGECAAELKYKTFSGIIDGVENDRGADLPGMTRDPRGLVYHPHTHEAIALGTLAVEAYRRPEWLFSNVIYIEKEGFFNLLQDDGWPERYDCALMTTKGQSTRAAKDFIDMVAGSNEPTRVFCLHDADAAGTMIYQSLQEATIARPRRLIEIVNLGLEPWEARAMGLQDEAVPVKKDRRPVAAYVQARGEGWANWLQRRRYELDSIPPVQFVPWLDAKMASQGVTKVVPDADTLGRHAEERVPDDLRSAFRAELLERLQVEQHVEAMMTRAMPIIEAAIDRRRDTFAADIRRGIEERPQHHWSAVFDGVVEHLKAQVQAELA